MTQGYFDLNISPEIYPHFYPPHMKVESDINEDVVTIVVTESCAVVTRCPITNPNNSITFKPIPEWLKTIIQEQNGS